MKQRERRKRITLKNKTTTRTKQFAYQKTQTRKNNEKALPPKGWPSSKRSWETQETNEQTTRNKRDDLDWF